MIILDKWYPVVMPKNEIRTIAFEKAVEKVQEEYKYALNAHKDSLKKYEYDVELCYKRARDNTIELEMFGDRRRFQIFV
jgi:transcription elongation factor GreA-like protein